MLKTKFLSQGKLINNHLIFLHLLQTILSFTVNNGPTRLQVQYSDRELQWILTDQVDQTKDYSQLVLESVLSDQITLSALQ